MSRRRTPRRARSAKRPKARKRRTRVLLKLAVVPLVLVLGGLLVLGVSLNKRFEGRLWQLPSRIYSDVLVLEPGDRLDPAPLTERLDRTGYGRVRGVPRRAGQYSLDRGVLDVRLRPFSAGGYETNARRLRLLFENGQVAAILDGVGRAQPQAVFAPELLATLFGPRQEERIPVRLDQVPDVLQHAVLAAEDGRFYKHHGLDPRGIARAAGANLRERKIVQGGSTITQQTVKNLFLGQQRTWWRKIREGVMSVMLDAQFSKQRILEVYLNEVYLGQRGSVAICGVQAASRFYFGRDQRDLSLSEAATLAGLIRSPGRYNPFRHPDTALARRDQVLESMRKLGRATEEQIEAARAERLNLASGGGGYSGAAYAADFVQTQLTQLYSREILHREGLAIYTTLDTNWQRRAEESLIAGLERSERRTGRKGAAPLEGAVIVTDPASGAILAMVGGRDYGRSQFNRAVQARRQPGSAFKPFVFAAALERAAAGHDDGLTLATMLEDSPLEMRSGGKIWAPANYDRDYRGRVSARSALELSLNVPTVRVGQRVGLSRVIDTAKRMGIRSKLTPVPSLALGTEEVSPLELAQAYATLARQGRYRSAWVIREVVDREGQVLARQRTAWSDAISPETAFLVTDAMRGVFERGTARSAARLGFSGDAAGKTGTTDDTRDAWFVGYTNELLALVWVGYDDNTTTGLTGASGALPIWVDLMRRGGAASARSRFPVPDGIVLRRVDPDTGGLSHGSCPRRHDELFAVGSEPTRKCVEHSGRFRRWFRKLTADGGR